MSKRASGNDGAALNEDGIYKETVFRPEECPAEVRDLFQCVYDTQWLRHEEFARVPSASDKSESVLTNHAAHDYDVGLSNRAREFNHQCTEQEMADSPEMKWMNVMEPFVFFEFDRTREETRPWHHW